MAMNYYKVTWTLPGANPRSAWKGVDIILAISPSQAEHVVTMARPDALDVHARHLDAGGIPWPE